MDKNKACAQYCNFLKYIFCGTHLPYLPKGNSLQLIGLKDTVHCTLQNLIGKSCVRNLDPQGSRVRVYFFCRISDPHPIHVDPDPDPGFQIFADPDP